MKKLLATAVMLFMALPMITQKTETKIPITNIPIVDEYGGCSSDDNSSLNQLIIYGKVSM